MHFFSMGWVSNGGRDRSEIWHKGRGEDDARTSNTHAIPHSTMTNNRNMTYVVVTALCNQPKACALDLGDGQSRYLYL